MRTVSPTAAAAVTTYSPGSNIYTRIPTRPSTAMGAAAYFPPNDHQLKLSPTSVESSLMIPTTSSAYIYPSYANGILNNLDSAGLAGPMGHAAAGYGGSSMQQPQNANPGPPDSHQLPSNYVLYGQTTKQQSPNRLLGAGLMNSGVCGGGGAATTVTTPLISTAANYNGFGKTGLVTTTTTANYDEFIS